MPFYRFHPRAFHAVKIPPGSQIHDDPNWGNVPVGCWACVAPGNVRFVLSDEAFKVLSFPVKDICEDELCELKDED